MLDLCCLPNVFRNPSCASFMLDFHRYTWHYTLRSVSCSSLILSENCTILLLVRYRFIFQFSHNFSCYYGRTNKRKKKRLRITILISTISISQFICFRAIIPVNYDGSSTEEKKREKIRATSKSREYSWLFLRLEEYLFLFNSGVRTE